MVTKKFVLIFVVTLYLFSLKEVKCSNIFTSEDYNFEDEEEKNLKLLGSGYAKKGQFPYHAAIKIYFPNDQEEFCSGALIDQKWVITTGTCVKNAIKFDVKLGAILRTNDSEVNTFETTTNKGIVHPDFNEYYNNNIGLIELEEEVNITRYVRPIKLPSKESATDLMENKYVTVTGWGNTYDFICDEKDCMLEEVLAYNSIHKTSTNKWCLSLFGNKIVDESIICFGLISKGDTGDPLVITINLEHTLIGIASFKEIDPRSGSPTKPVAGFVRIGHYLDWIGNTTGILIEDGKL